MFGLMILMGSLLITTIVAQANKYPAGLDPATCPNYPLCDNRFLAAQNEHAVGTHAMAFVHHQSGAHFSPFSSSPSFYVPQAAPGYPVGLSPSACPNYPYCSYHIPQAASHYNHGYPRNYPSGVSSHICPNYPFCH